VGAFPKRSEALKSGAEPTGLLVGDEVKISLSAQAILARG
jgi:hypothetical protein